jgi:hypothetical protein
VGFKALYDAQAKTMGVRNGDVLLYRTLQDKAGMLTPNITTLYAFSFWDLAKHGPLVVEVPAGLIAGGVMDIWQQPITDMGQTGPDKGAGGKYLILPPDQPGHHGAFITQTIRSQVKRSQRVNERSNTLDLEPGVFSCRRKSSAFRPVKSTLTAYIKRTGKHSSSD